MPVEVATKELMELVDSGQVVPTTKHANLEPEPVVQVCFQAESTPEWRQTSASSGQAQSSLRASSPLLAQLACTRFLVSDPTHLCSTSRPSEARHMILPASPR